MIIDPISRQPIDPRDPDGPAAEFRRRFFAVVKPAIDRKVAEAGRRWAEEAEDQGWRIPTFAHKYDDGPPASINYGPPLFWAAVGFLAGYIACLIVHAAT